jgi:hypothetical protein
MPTPRAASEFLGRHKKAAAAWESGREGHPFAPQYAHAREGIARL